MNRRSFFAATAATAVVAPLTAPQASITPDPALEAAERYMEAQQRLEDAFITPAAVAMDDIPLPRVTSPTGYVYDSVSAIDTAKARDARLNPSSQHYREARAPALEAEYAKASADLAAQRRAYDCAREACGLAPAERMKADALDALVKVRPTTPLGAAAILTALSSEWEADDLSLLNVISSLEGMDHG